jgi:hypothetical protein
LVAGAEVGRTLNPKFPGGVSEKRRRLRDEGVILSSTVRLQYRTAPASQSGKKRRTNQLVGPANARCPAVSLRAKFPALKVKPAGRRRALDLHRLISPTPIARLDAPRSPVHAGVLVVAGTLTIVATRAEDPLPNVERLKSSPVLQHLKLNPLTSPARTGPEQTLARMYVPEGFKVDIVAGEPDLHQPVAFAFDERGRIGVAGADSDPTKRPAGQGADKDDRNLPLLLGHGLAPLMAKTPDTAFHLATRTAIPALKGCWNPCPSASRSSC